MFELRINGQKVWSSERQVTRVSMQSARGEIGAAGISPQDGVIDIFVEEVAPGGPPRIEEVEAKRAREIADVEEGTVVGNTTYTPATDANKPQQGVADRGKDIPAGGPDVGEKPELLTNLPETTPTGSLRNPDGSVDTSVLDQGTSDPRVNPPKDENGTAGADLEPGSLEASSETDTSVTAGDDDTGKTGDNFSLS